MAELDTRQSTMDKPTGSTGPLRDRVPGRPLIATTSDIFATRSEMIRDRVASM